MESQEECLRHAQCAEQAANRMSSPEHRAEMAAIAEWWRNRAPDGAFPAPKPKVSRDVPAGLESAVGLTQDVRANLDAEIHLYVEHCVPYADLGENLRARLRSVRSG